MGVKPAVSEICLLTLLTFSYVWNIFPTKYNDLKNPPSSPPPLSQLLISSISFSMMMMVEVVKNVEEKYHQDMFMGMGLWLSG